MSLCGGLQVLYMWSACVNVEYPNAHDIVSRVSKFGGQLEPLQGEKNVFDWHEMNQLEDAQFLENGQLKERVLKFMVANYVEPISYDLTLAHHFHNFIPTCNQSRGKRTPKKLGPVTCVSEFLFPKT